LKSQPVSPQTPSQASSTPFYLACVTLVVCSAAVVTVTRSSGLGALGFLAGVALAMFFLVLPSWLEHRAAGLDQLHLALAELETRAYDLDSVRREHRRALARSEELQEKAEELAGVLREQAGRLAELFGLQEELIQARQDRQRAQNLLEARDRVLVEHHDSLERLLSQEGLSPEYLEATTRALQQLRRTLSSTGLDPIRPEPGDPLDERMHQVLGVQQPRSEVPEHHVIHCERSGFRRGDTILRRAEVFLAAASGQTEGQA